MGFSVMNTGALCFLIPFGECSFVIQTRSSYGIPTNNSDYGAFMMKKELNPKKLILIFLALVVLFIPTYIAIGSYYKNKPQPVKENGSRVLTLKDPKQNISVITWKAPDEMPETMAFFEKLIKDASSTASVPDSFSGGDFLLATFEDLDADNNVEKSVAYSFYFSIDPDKCYFRDSSGKAYKIVKDEALEFLESTYSVYLYSEAEPPALNVSGTDIQATELNWYYLGAGNKFLPLSKEGGTNETMDLDVGNTLEFNFSSEPGETLLKVYNGEELLYNGAHGLLGPLNISKNATLRFELYAEWPKTDGVSYYGSANYIFNAMITAPAEFKLGQKEIYQGEFAVIAALNVRDPSKITFKSEPEINSVPVFYPAGEVCYALIPVSYGLNYGNYKFTVSYGVTTSEFEVKVNNYEYSYKDGKLDVSKALIDSCYSAADQDEYKALVKQICTSSDYSVAEGKLFSGKFNSYEEKNVILPGGATLVLGFARNVKLTNAATPTYFEHTGVDFSVPAGTAVPAMNAGRVVYVGSCDVLGQFVVVDHGLGLKSWYAHLGSASVKVGDTVETGGILGLTGDSGLTPTGRVHVGFTVGEIPVTPYGLWNGRPVFPTFD